MEALRIAKTQIGQRPCPDKPRPICRTWGPVMKEYLESVGITAGGGVDYCAAFVNWCFKEAAGTLKRTSPIDQKSGDIHIARAPRGIYNLARRQGYLKPTPLPGDVYLHFYVKDGEEHQHAGIVEEVHGDKMDTVEGNTWITEGQWGVWPRKNKPVRDTNPKHKNTHIYFVRLE